MVCLDEERLELDLRRDSLARRSQRKQGATDRPYLKKLLKEAADSHRSYRFSIHLCQSARHSLSTQLFSYQFFEAEVSFCRGNYTS
jgi:hypothetical protein